jgi:hypothetical protein
MKKSKNDGFVTIKLEKWQVKHLIGAMRLGIWSQDWCATLVQTISVCDTDSLRWMANVNYLIEMITAQTGVSAEERGMYADNVTLNIIQGLVNKQCQQYELEMQKQDEKLQKDFNKN